MIGQFSTVLFYTVLRLSILHEAGDHGTDGHAGRSLSEDSRVLRETPLQDGGGCTKKQSGRGGNPLLRVEGNSAYSTIRASVLNHRSPCVKTILRKGLRLLIDP